MKTNRLIREKSPYLLQHASNPVDWYPWGPEAFSRAREEQKPIFLSVGYSTCHWCHVMERESFENESVASLLNEYFVPVKVDREERPDVDRIYMTALQAMGQNGGWPMSMFLTPELKPFYGGTYFPPESRYGRAGFPDILRRVHEIWMGEKEKVQESAEGMASFLAESAGVVSGAALPGTGVLEHCFEQLRRSFDEEHGGFGRGAKFPRPAGLAFLFRFYHRTGRPEVLAVAEKTLQAMAAGGIHDHVGGGFHRYTVDREWRVPHFEKMLYDQAQLVQVYLDAFQLTGNEAYAAIVRSTLEYVLRDMTGPRGGFFSAEDADSPLPENPAEQGEGAFYLWTRAELAAVLGESDSRLFSLHFGVEEGGNAPFDPQQEFAGKNILYIAEPPAGMARVLGKPESEIREVLERSRTRLLAVRSARPRPLRDDKVLTSWNGMMLGALARAGAVLDEARYVEAAQRSADFLLSELMDPGTGHLMRRYREGDVRVEGQLDDYAHLAAGLLELFEASQAPRWLSEAVRVAGRMMTLFHDTERGGFFDTQEGDPSLLARLKESYDGAEPSANSVAACLLCTLSALTGSDEWRRTAERTVAAFSELLARQPVGMPNMAVALDLLLTPPTQVVIVGKSGVPDRRTMLREVHRRFLPGAVLVVLDPSLPGERPAVHADILSLGMREERTTAYICRDFVCNLPTQDPAAVGAMLDRSTSV